MRRIRAGVVIVCAFAIGAAIAMGCGDDAVTPAAIDAGTPTPTGDDDDDFEPSDDDDTTDMDAGKKVDVRDANGPGGDGATCVFNWDCQLKLRCECDGECACNPGKRGARKPGGGCEGGNDCVSAVCLDGPNNNELLCSDACKVPADCPTILPRCEKVALVGRICVREPPP